MIHFIELCSQPSRILFLCVSEKVLSYKKMETKSEQVQKYNINIFLICFLFKGGFS